MQKVFAACSILFVTTMAVVAQPKIGLTLSGGGAKGLAHIGVLKAIDSAGLRVDYITGTSMGSIMGALYAAGYSGNEIEKIARSLDWAFLFSGKPSMQHVSMDEKNELGNYAIEVPFEEKKFKIFSGFIEGQEIWLKFQELFLPVYNVKDFSRFSIPFRCIATDVSTGKAVVLQQGEIVTAIRSSMAIPSIFTPIDYKGTKLVDGGVVRNFPVKDVKEMGADYVIGVNLSQGLLPAKDLNSAVDILYQIGFYKDADDFLQERKLCNILIEPNLQNFTAASFSSADSIISAGNETGKKYYPVFKKLADSLRRIYPAYKVIPKRLPEVKKVTMDSIRIEGLHHTTKTSFTNTLGLEPGKQYDGVDVAQAIRRVHGSLNYKRITYAWSPTSKDHATLLFNVSESPLTYFKFGIHYNNFSKIALIAAVSSKNLLFDRSKTSMKLNISENFRFLFEHNQLFGEWDNNNLIVSAYHERFQYPIYQDFKELYLYRSRFARVDLRLQHTVGLSTAFGLGTSLEYFGLKPRITGLTEETKGNNRYIHSYAYFQYNSLNRKEFTTSGWDIRARAGIIYGQHPNLNSVSDSATNSLFDVPFKNYQQAQLKIENFRPLSSRSTWITQFNAGVNFNYQRAYFNFFNVGGIVDFLRNQIPFVGINEYEINTGSVATVGVGYQYQLLKSLYITARLNAATYDFLEKDIAHKRLTKYLTGYGVSVGYNSGIGPVSLSMMYSDQAQQLSGYVNIGFHF